MDNEVTVTPQFSWGAWIGGFFLTLIGGGLLNIVAGLGAMAVQSKIFSPLIGAIPGLLFVLIAYAWRKRARAFAMGVFTAACIIALIGGICGQAMSGGLDFK